MKKLTYIALLAMTSTTAAAEENRQLDAHEHGVGQLDIAFDGTKIAMELHAPGADIVGFEYAAESAEDRAKVDAAVATLASPLNLFELPAAAGCSVTQASAELESEEPHDDHDEHADHAEEGHSDEDHAAHKEEGHDHDDHAEHAQEASHTEFHAEYLLDCADTSAANLIAFAYFDAFPNALELEVQVITEKGATAFEIERDAPTLDLRDMF